MNRRFTFSFFALPPRVAPCGTADVEAFVPDDVPCGIDAADWVADVDQGDGFAEGDLPGDDSLTAFAPDDDPEDEPGPDDPEDGGHPPPVPLPPAPIGPSGPA